MVIDNKIFAGILIGSAALATNAIASKVIEVLNENEKRFCNQAVNTVAVIAGCVAVGAVLGTLVVIENQQDEILELLHMEEAS